MKLQNYQTWLVYCKCGRKLVKYLKKGSGRLRKIHRDRIVKDYAGVFMDQDSPVGTSVLCPKCKERIATIRKVKGKYVNKVNQGLLGNIKK